jgi:CoA:oxalate CoA-transferase
VPCSPINTVADAVENPQVRARNMIATAGGLRMAGNPIKLSAFPDPPTRAPAPELDADGEAVRRSLPGECSERVHWPVLVLAGGFVVIR